jgi:hypothetical protein
MMATAMRTVPRDTPSQFDVARYQRKGRAELVDAIRGYVEALGGTVDVVARVGDWTVRVA